MYSVKVAFTRETKPDLISRVIMYFLKTPYSHVLILFEDVDNKEKIFHCIGAGTCIDEDKIYFEDHVIVKQYKIPMKVSREEFSGYARGRCGRDYSQSQYINLFLEMMGIKWIPFRNGNSGAICSEEIVAAAYMSALDLPQDVELDLIDPREVDDFLSKQSKAEREL